VEVSVLVSLVGKFAAYVRRCRDCATVTLLEINDNAVKRKSASYSTAIDRSALDCQTDAEKQSIEIIGAIETEPAKWAAILAK